MIKNVLYFIALFSLIQLNGFSQERYVATVTKTETVIKKNFNNRLDSLRYLLYNLNDKYIIITDETCCYKQYFIQEGFGVQKIIEIKKKNKVLKRAFDLSSYNKDFVGVESDSIYQYYNTHSKFVYFFVKSEGLKYGEFYLPILFNVKVEDKKFYPIDKRVHEFLIEQIITHWKNEL